MESQMGKKYLMDKAAIIFALIVLWTVLIFVMLNIEGITPTKSLKLTIFAIGILMGIFATAASIAVLIHLKKNKKILYITEMNAKK
ncbi:MAG: hypothetical protein JJE18_04285 [Eubacteriaceae bacterium]|nr:hypothetical protein [Eubacteriaceae bacterium]